MVSLSAQPLPLTSEMLERGTEAKMQTIFHAIWKPNTRSAGMASISIFPDPLLVPCPAPT